MKLTLIFSFLLVVTSWGKTLSQTTKLSLNLKNVPVQKLIEQIEDLTEFYFLYQDDVFRKDQKVSIESIDASVESIMQQMAEQASVQYCIFDRQIVLLPVGDIDLPAGIKKQLNSQIEQKKSITGKVTDSTGGSLPGVSAIVKGTTIGTISDNQGNFILQVPSDAKTLQFSFVGMKTQEIAIAGKTSINVVLEEETVGIEEVVAVGYGTMKKSDLTGSISSVSAEELTARPVPTVGAALQGRASGVLVKTQSSKPGGGSIVQIRGSNSIYSSSSPLYVVDGIPNADIDGLDPADIQSLEVLKDASSTAVYGSRGANGVVLISTKKGKIGKPVITFSSRFTFDDFVDRLKLTNGEEYVQIYNDWERMKQPNITDAQLWYNGSEFYRPTLQTVGEGTNWFDVLSRPGLLQNNILGISGGSDVSTYSVSINYMDHKGIMLGSEFQRAGFRASNSYKVTDWFSTGFDLYINRSMNDNSVNVSAIYMMSPTDPLYKPDGTYAENTIPSSGGSSSPYAEAVENTNKTRRQRVFGNYYMKFEPLKDLSLKISVGGDADESKNMRYEPRTTYNGKLANGIASVLTNTANYWISENIISYKKQIGIHRFDFMGGFTYEQTINEQFNATSKGFITDAYLYNNLQGASSPGAPETNKTKSQLASFLGRGNYVLNDKYLVSVTFRDDGSSKFGEGNKWGFFPSIAGAWRISEESFMKNSPAFTNLKLRVGYGSVGNSGIGLYKSLAAFGTDNYTFGGLIVPGVSLGGDKKYNTNPDDVLNSLDNKDLKWETTKNSNIGIDISLYNKFHFTIDAYYKKTTDLLMKLNLIETTGTQNALMNVGSMQNKGIEFSADMRVVDKVIKWDVKGFISANRNEILELNGDASSAWKIGLPLGVARTWVTDGILETQAELDAYKNANGDLLKKGAKLGDYRYKDINGDGKIDGSDYTVTFDPNPKFIYSINNDFSYKNFSLSISMYGSQGHQIYNKIARHLTSLITIGNNLRKDIVNNYWTPNHTTGVKYPAVASLSYNDNHNANIEDGSFLRLQNVMLSYNLPFKRVFKNARVYVSGQNLLTITKYTGYDPDVSANATPITSQADQPGQNSAQQYGFDYGAYPTPVSWTFGLDITF